MRILLVEDDTVLGDGLSCSLTDWGFDVTLAENAAYAEAALLTQPYDLLILDLGLPDRDGREILRQLRARKSTMPVLILTARDALNDRVGGLELGADDYMVKPFSPKELEARIKAILRRLDRLSSSSQTSASGIISMGSIRIDTNRRQVYKHNEKIRLTGMEFSLLELLISKSGEPFSRAAILQEVWGYTPERHVDTRVVDVHISRLRSKLEEDPSNPDLILTARGTGYLFQKITENSSFE